MKNTRERLLGDVKSIITEEITKNVSPEILDLIEAELYGPKRSLIADNPSSEQVSSGLDVMINQLDDALRKQLPSHHNEETNDTL